MFAATKRKACNVAETEQKNKNILKDCCRRRKLLAKRLRIILDIFEEKNLGGQSSRFFSRFLMILLPLIGDIL